MKNIFQKNVRHDQDLIETSAQYQMIKVEHGQISFSYAWDEKDIHEAEGIEVRKRGDFAPHYTYDNG